MRSCDGCGKTDSPVRRCSACNTVAYCSVRCQQKHWRHGGHKEECKAATMAGTPLWGSCGWAYIGKKHKCFAILPGVVVEGVLWTLLAKRSHSLWGFMRNRKGQLCDVIQIIGGSVIDHRRCPFQLQFELKASGYLASALACGVKRGLHRV